MLQVLFSIYSVSLWQNYSATYWSGMFTTLFRVGFSVCLFLYMQIFLRRRHVYGFLFRMRKKRLDRESSGFVWMSPMQGRNHGIDIGGVQM